MVHFLHAPHPNFQRITSIFTEAAFFASTLIDVQAGLRRCDILKSTRSNILDQAAISAFMRWQCEPGSLTQVTIPLSFGQ